MLVQRHNENEMREELKKVGGCNEIVMAPYSSYTVMNAILHALQRRRLVEYSYRDLREHVEKDYPHLAVFEDILDIDSVINIPKSQSPEPALASTMKLKAIEEVPAVSVARLAGSPNTSRISDSRSALGASGSRSALGTPSMKASVKAPPGISAVQQNLLVKLEEEEEAEGHGNDAELEELDDWTNSSSLFPAYVNKQRKVEHQGEVLSPKGVTPMEALSIRRQVDGEITKKLTNKLKSSGDLVLDNTSMVVDAYEKAQEILKNQHEAARLATERNKKAHDSLPLLHAPHIENIYDVNRRPKWGMVANSASESPSQSGTASPTKSHAVVAASEMHPFIERPLPNLQHRQRLTVVGMDRRMAAQCWRMISGGKAKFAEQHPHGHIAPTVVTRESRNSTKYDTSTVGVQQSAILALSNIPSLSGMTDL